MDRQTIEKFHIPGLILMETAALRVVETLEKRFSPLKGKRISVVCGMGSNGGDGLSIARQLIARNGAQVTVWLAGDSSRFQGDADTSYQMLKDFGVTICPASDLDLSKAEIVIDALFGTGINGAVTGEPARIIQVMNQSGKAVVSVDVPSGLDIDTGRAEGAVVQALLTVTYSLPKFGLLEYPGAAFTGELIVAEIGMPSAVMDAPQIKAYVTEPVDLATSFPARINNRDANKGAFGHVTVFAGSDGFVGAPVMVAEAAARSGAGLVTLAVPESIQQVIMARVSPVVMTKGLKQTSAGTFCSASLDSALSLAGQTKTVALGPGIGLGDEVAAFVRAFIAECAAPLVIDADALNLLAREPNRGRFLFKYRNYATVLTPHPGEMGRLLGISTKAVEEDRRSAVTLAASNYGCIVLLKGARTLIASPDGMLHLNTTGNPGMSTGGAGDALTGVIAALLAQDLEPLKAAAFGAYLHGLAGDIAAQEQGGMIGLLATDVLSHLPQAIAHCQNSMDELPKSVEVNMQGAHLKVAG